MQAVENQDSLTHATCSYLLRFFFTEQQYSLYKNFDSLYG